jgi:hypothetical protein
MPLNLEGIAKLKATLRANARHYNQASFARTSASCGTECCLAGWCLVTKLGMEEVNDYVRELDDSDRAFWYKFDTMRDRCLAAAVDQLGVELLDAESYSLAASPRNSESLPPIFADVRAWPLDLRHSYKEALVRHDHPAMVEIACRALDRMDVNGFIRPEEAAQ